MTFDNVISIGLCKIILITFFNKICIILIHIDLFFWIVLFSVIFMFIFLTLLGSFIMFLFFLMTDCLLCLLFSHLLRWKGVCLCVGLWPEAGCQMWKQIFIDHWMYSLSNVSSSSFTIILLFHELKYLNLTRFFFNF